MPSRLPSELSVDLPLIKAASLFACSSIGYARGTASQGFACRRMAAVACGWIFHPPPELFTMGSHKQWAEQGGSQHAWRTDRRGDRPDHGDARAACRRRWPEGGGVVPVERDPARRPCLASRPVTNATRGSIGFRRSARGPSTRISRLTTSGTRFASSAGSHPRRVAVDGEATSCLAAACDCIPAFVDRGSALRTVA